MDNNYTSASSGLIDTDDLLDESDRDMIAKINAIKRDITSYFDMELFVDKIRKIIDSSDVFTFKNESNRKFIEPQKPRFVIKFKNQKDLNEVLSNKTYDTTETVKIRTDITVKAVVSEIINKFSREITDCIKDQNKIDELFKDLPKGLDKIIIGNIYTINCDIENNTIHIIYFI